MKSIMVRYQQIRERGFNEEDSTNLNMITKALATVGIKAADAQGNLRDFQDILDELAPMWKNLTQKQQDYIQTQMAGIYQANRFAALMNNYSDSIGFYELALNSAGTAQQKFDIYMESNEAKANKFKSTMDKLWLDTFNSESIGKLIEFGTTTVEFVDKIGLLNIAIGVLSITFIAFSHSIGTALVTLTAYITEFGILETMTLAFNPIIAGIILALGAFAIAMSESNRINKEAKERIEEVDTAYEDFNKTLNSGKINEVKSALDNLVNKVDYDKAITKISQLKDEIANLQALADNSPALGGNFSIGMNDYRISTRQAEIDRLQRETNKVEAARKNYEDLLNTPDTVLSRKRNQSNNGKTPPPPPPKDPKDVSLSDILTKQQEYENKITEAENLSKNLLSDEYDLRLKNLDAEKLANEEMLKYLESQKDSAKKHGLSAELQEKILSVQGALQGIEKTRKELNQDIAKKIEEQTKKLEEQKKKAEDLIENYENYLINQLEKKIDLIEEEKRVAKEASEEKIKSKEDEIEQLERENDEKKEQQEREEKLLELTKERQKLNNIRKERDVRVLTDKGWEWTYDQQAYAQQKETVDNLQLDFNQFEAENKRQANIQELKDELDSLKDEEDAEQKSFDNRIRELNKFVDENKNKIYEQKLDTINSYTELYIELQKLDKSSYENRLADLQSFISSYNSKMGQLDNMPSSSSSSSSSGKSILGNIVSGVKNIFGFDTGGYTSDSEGLAYLDKKEIVLNKLDTENLLKAVDITRNMIQPPKLPQFNLASAGNNSNSKTIQIHIDKLVTPNSKQFLREMENRTALT